MDHPLLAGFSPSEHKPGRTQKTDRDLVRAAGDVATTIFHPVGTAKMGSDTDCEAVVSENLGSMVCVVFISLTRRLFPQ